MATLADPGFRDTAYVAARDRLCRDYAALPVGMPVRLRKRTSNLFRTRQPVRQSLDVTGFDRVFHVDPVARTADVGGMTTYADLVAATLPHGLMPLVVPQLRTITLGGAVTGLGIEASSFRNGMPHESVLAAEILTGAGEVVLATPTGEHAALFRAFPNSYGSLGYALVLRIELEPVQPFVELRHLPFRSPTAAAAAIAELAAPGSRCAGRRVDFLDGVAFSPEEIYLTVGSFTAEPAIAPSDYTGREIYYRSIARRSRDVLTINDYLWRWDTDWFWCSKAFGAQHPLLRALWPARARRSDVYWRLTAFDSRLRLSDTVRRVTGKPPVEKVIQDVEVPVEELAGFLPELDRITGLRPVWLCPVRTRPGSPDWPLYPLAPGRLYVNLGFWGTVPASMGEARGGINRRVEEAVQRFGGAKSLYSTAYYDRAVFDQNYGGVAYRAVKSRYDPAARLSDLYEKVVGGR